MNEQSVISVRNLSRVFGAVKALSGVSLEVKAGSVVGVLGPNGSGKTTLMKHLIGALLPHHGHVDVFGVLAGELTSEQVAQIGFVSQGTELLSWRNVGETLDFARAHHRQWDSDLVARLVSDFDLKRQQNVGKLSGGQKQRLAIILGVAHRPTLLLLDARSFSIC